MDLGGGHWERKMAAQKNETSLPNARSSAHCSGMKSNLPIIFLVLVCLGLGIYLWKQNQDHAVHAAELQKTVISQSTRANDLEEKLNLQVLTNTILETNLAAVQVKYSNELAAAEASLSITSSNYDKALIDKKVADDAVKAASAAIAERDAKIKELEGQNVSMDKASGELRAQITSLEAQINAAKDKLAKAEGDEGLLLAEVKRLESQKEELERKLSDLASLKEQVRLLRDNLSIANRIDWLRRGLYDTMKGGQRLITPQPPVPQPPVPPPTNKSLDVEIHQTGGVRINSPAPTNAPGDR